MCWWGFGVCKRQTFLKKYRTCSAGGWDVLDTRMATKLTQLQTQYGHFPIEVCGSFAPSTGRRLSEQMPCPENEKQTQQRGQEARGSRLDQDALTHDAPIISSSGEPSDVVAGL